jgi:hypothetical protein
MKKTLTTAAYLLITISSFAQLTINSKSDEMTDEIYYTVSEGLVCANEESTIGFRIDANITIKNSSRVIKNIIVKLVGLERCNEKNTLIILFDNGEKITLTSWNKFNCKGTAYFSLDSKTIEALKYNEISKIRITNGRSFKSYTNELKYKSYFIELFEALNKINN